MKRVSVAAAVRRKTGTHARAVALWLLPSALATAVWFGTGPIIVPPARPVVIAVLLIACLVASRVELRVELRHQTYTIMPTEIPLVIGLFVVSPLALLGIRVASSLSLLLDRRRLPGKQVFNAGISALEVAVSVAIFQAATQHPVTSPA